MGPHTMLRAPKSKNYGRRCSGEGYDCYSCNKLTQQAIVNKEANASLRSNKSQQG